MVEPVASEKSSRIQVIKRIRLRYWVCRKQKTLETFINRSSFTGKSGLVLPVVLVLVKFDSGLGCIFDESGDR